jgi:hypothetical protein
MVVLPNVNKYSAGNVGAVEADTAKTKKWVEHAHISSGSWWPVSLPSC